MNEVMLYAGAFVVGCCSGFLGSTVGSGALLVLPTLIIMGFSPKVAIGTTKVGDLGTFLISLRNYYRAGKIKIKESLFFSVLSAVGCILGLFLVFELSDETLRWWITICIGLLIPAIFVKRDVGLKSRKVHPFSYRLGLFLFLLTCVNSSIVPAGGATLSLFVFVYLMGFEFVGGYATLILPFFARSVIPAVVFMWSGYVDYGLAVCLFAGGVVGGNYGSRLAVDKGNPWVRTLFVTVLILILVKIVFDT